MNKLNKLVNSLNILERVKRIKELTLWRLDNANIKLDSLISRIEKLNQLICSMQKDLQIKDTSQSQLTSSLLHDNHRLWPWNYTPTKVPPYLPSGRPWPKISIVTTCYNHGNYIEETIRSVILQGYPNLEYIVVDGASTDNTLEILERYENDITLCISEPDEGQTHALNKGFGHATGDILAWLNSDDQYLPDTLIRVAEAFDTYKCDVIVGGCQLIRDYNRTVIQTHHCSLPFHKLTPLPYESMLDFGRDWLDGKFFFQPEAFWSRRAWDLIGGTLNENLNFGMDYEFWLRLAREKVIACHIPNDLAIFRMHEMQKTIFSGKIADYPEYNAISRYYQALDSIEIPDRERQIVELPRIDGSGSDSVDITATFPPDKFARRPLILYSTSHGKYYLPFDGTLGPITRKIRSGKLAFPELIEVAHSYIQPGTTVIDIGTQFGQTTYLLAEITGEQGQVLAFEPDAYLFHALQKTLAANHVYNVRSYLRLAEEHSDQMLALTESSTNSEWGESIALDDLNISEPVSFIKISADGHEAKALRGAANTILKYRPAIVVAGNPQSWNGIIEELGYYLETNLDSTWSLLKPDPNCSPSLQPNQPTSDWLSNPRLPVTTLCKFLKSRTEVESCTAFLHRHGFASHNLICKDWDLAHIVSEIGDGNFLDMGSSDSYILKNLAFKRIKGELYGIDLQDPDFPVPGVKYLKGDLMDTGLPSQHFKNISCLSVIEHEVNFDRFTQEVSRLLQVGGRLFVTFDYWEPKITPPIRLYELEWQPLDRDKLIQFIAACNRQGLKLLQDMDWSLGDPVIQYGYYAPHPTMKYTFGMAVFEKC